MLSKKTFAAGMALLASNFEKMERVTKDQTIGECWYAALNDCEDKAFMQAVTAIVKTSKYAPTIADIFDHIRNNNGQHIAAEEAWAIVYRDVRRCGYYAEPTYPDWRVEGAKNAIGWDTLCDMTPDTAIGTRAHFFKIYDSLEKRQKQLDTSAAPQLQELTKRIAETLTGKNPTQKQLVAGNASHNH